jgi:hypothetical protein
MSILNRLGITISQRALHDHLRRRTDANRAALLAAVKAGAGLVIDNIQFSLGSSESCSAASASDPRFIAATSVSFVKPRYVAPVTTPFTASYVSNAKNHCLIRLSSLFGSLIPL